MPRRAPARVAHPYLPSAIPETTARSSNTQADLPDIVVQAGFGWVTSHVYRKTVATLMDDAGLSARRAADQRGHSKISMTQDFYFGRKVAATGAKEVREIFGTTSTPGTHRCGSPGGRS